MKTTQKLLKLLIVLVFPTVMSAQSGKVFDNLSMKSTVLGFVSQAFHQY